MGGHDRRVMYKPVRHHGRGRRSGHLRPGGADPLPCPVRTCCSRSGHHKPARFFVWFNNCLRWPCHQRRYVPTGSIFLNRRGRSRRSPSSPGHPGHPSTACCWKNTPVQPGTERRSGLPASPPSCCRMRPSLTRTQAVVRTTSTGWRSSPTPTSTATSSPSRALTSSPTPSSATAPRSASSPSDPLGASAQSARGNWTGRVLPGQDRSRA